MSDLTQALNGEMAVWIVVGLCILCAGGGVLFAIMQFIGFGLDIVFNLFHIVASVITGGPVTWCGCLVFLFVCGGCGFSTIVLASILPNCGTPEAVNLCRFLGR